LHLVSFAIMSQLSPPGGPGAPGGPGLPRIFYRKGVPLWRDAVVLQWIAQIISAVLVLGFLWFFINNVLRGAEARGLSWSYSFLSEAAGFPISESIIPYDEGQTFGYAFIVGVLNTLKVSLVGIVLATVVGVVTAVARLSTNWLVSKIASVYIETIRNVPLLVQLFFWYFGFFQRLPPVQEAAELPGPIYLSQRGLYMVWFQPTSTFWIWMIFVGVALTLAAILYLLLSRYQIQTGKSTYPVASALVILLVLPVVGWFVAGDSPLVTTTPVLGKFNFEGGLRLTPEFVGLLVGLVIYTGAFIAEVVRAGILAVSKGQFEAARAVGLTNMQVLRLVVFPQALRVIIPPLISQYLNLTKNSSLAILIGYADVFFVGRTIINQSGRAVPVFILIMVIYLTISLITSIIMNIYNRRVRLVER
jgi:general L-amino acid transport system permease protein